MWEKLKLAEGAGLVYKAQEALAESWHVNWLLNIYEENILDRGNSKWQDPEIRCAGHIQVTEG